MLHRNHQDVEGRYRCSLLKRIFRQWYVHDALDASNLAIPFMGIVPRDHPTSTRTSTPSSANWPTAPSMALPVWRYLPEETDDGLHGQPEGAFTLPSFWLIGNLIYTEQTDRALDYFNEVVITQVNHLGLFAEMYDKSTGRQLGNFAQAYSHIVLIHSALNLSGYIADTPTRHSDRDAVD